MSKTTFQTILSQCSFFGNKTIDISSIYLDDPLEKCFLAKDTKSGKNYKIRFATNEFPETVKGEYNALHYLETHGIKWIPKIYFSELNNKKDILIYEYFDGESLDKIKNLLTDMELNLIREKLIVLVNELHSLGGKYFGDFTGNSFPTWQDYIGLKLFNHVKNAYDIGLLDKEGCGIIEKAFQSTIDYYKTVRSCFLHFDIKATNIIFNRNTGETNLIDFELCRFGDRNIEYSRFITYYNKPDELYKSLFIPLAKNFSELNYSEFISSRVFLLYNLYNLLAYYTTSYIKHGMVRDYLVQPLKDTMAKLG